jgi:predicted lactoylglutathione lyase
MRAQQIYVNHSVEDLKKSMAFFSSLGFEFKMEWTNDQGACLVLGDNMHVMLLTKPFFKSFTKKEIPDPRKTPESIICFSVTTKKEVDDIVTKAEKGGAKPHWQNQEHDFMYSHGFEDLDGHLWEIVSYEQTK